MPNSLWESVHKWTKPAAPLHQLAQRPSPRASRPTAEGQRKPVPIGVLSATSSSSRSLKFKGTGLPEASLQRSSAYSIPAQPCAAPNSLGKEARPIGGDKVSSLQISTNKLSPRQRSDRSSGTDGRGNVSNKSESLGASRHVQWKRPGGATGRDWRQQTPRLLGGGRLGLRERAQATHQRNECRLQCGRATWSRSSRE